MNSRIFLCSLAASLAGFLFGFDTVVISGAEQRIQDLWSLSPQLHGLTISMALWGTVVGALFGGWPTDRLGRQRTLLLIGGFYFVSAIASALAPEVYSLMAARFLGGLGVGISTVAAPLYIAEISPARYRGRLTGLFQFNIVFGILVAFLSNAFLSSLGDQSWRWMLGVEGVPAILFTLACIVLPESPRWLLAAKGDRVGALEALRKIQPDEDEEALALWIGRIEKAVAEEPAKGSLFSRRLRKPVLLAFFVAFFNQLSGINAVLYFAPRIFSLTGLEASAAILQSVGVGVTNLVFTFVGLYFVDRAGRKTLLVAGSLGYILSLGLCSWAFLTEMYSIVPWCIFAFIASHAIGQGAVIWVLISEVFPNRNRAAGTALGCGTHWVFAALITMVFPIFVSLVPPGYIFLFFAFMMTLQLVWVFASVPETKGKSLEELERALGLAPAKPNDTL